MKKPKLFSQTDPYTSANYYQDNLRYLEIMAEKGILSKKQPLHLHDELEFMFILEGTGTLHVNSVEYPVSEGCLILTYPFHVHALEPKTEKGLRYELCRFPLSLAIYLNISKQFAQTEISVLEYVPPCILLDKENRRLAREIFQELLQENASRSHGYDMALLSCILRLMVIQTRSASEIIEQRQTEERPLVWNVLQYLHMYFHFNIDAASVGQVFDISARHVNSSLRLLTGMNFSENLALVRIRNACALMQFEDLSLSFIAHSTGYSSLPNFFRQFKEVKGVKPAQYRETMQSGSQLSHQRFSNNTHEVLYYITEHYREPITASHVAKELYLSEDTINNSLKKSFGLTFPHLLSTLRLWVASGLLLGTDLPVFDIAMNMGFNSIRTFNRKFRLEFGVTPSEFRNSRNMEKTSWTGNSSSRP